jgi:hypothetical protein
MSFSARSAPGSEYAPRAGERLPPHPEEKPMDRITGSRLAGFACLLSLALLAACAPRLQGDVWVDEAADFGRYRTFAVSDYKRPAAGTPQAENRLLAEKLVAAELEKRGFQRTSAEQADMLLEVTLGARHKARTSGSSTWGTLGGMDVALLDRRTGRSLWRGWAAETWSESADAKVEIPKAVELLATQTPSGR